MLFFEKLPVLIFIRKNAIDLLFGSKQQTLQLPVDTIANFEIVNSEKYEKMITGFLSSAHFNRQSIFIVLSDEIIFQKIIPAAEIANIDQITQDFLDITPIEPEKLAKKSVKSGDRIHLLTTNKRLFELVIELVEKKGGRVLAVVPLTVFTNDSILTQQIVKKICASKNLVADTDFLTDSQNFPGKDNQTPKTKKNIIFYLLLFLFFTITAVFIVITLINYFKIQPGKQILPTKISVLKASPPPIASASAESSASAKLKNELTIDILNGTGTAGQALRVKNQLSELGFSNIETGNAEGVLTTKTIIIFSKNVADGIKKEITDALKENFITVTNQNDADEVKFDILITTGKTK